MENGVYDGIGPVIIDSEQPEKFWYNEYLNYVFETKGRDGILSSDQRLEYLPYRDNGCELGGGFGNGDVLSFDQEWTLIGDQMCHGPNNCYSLNTKICMSAVLATMGVVVFFCHFIMNRKHPRIRRYFERL